MDRHLHKSQLGAQKRAGSRSIRLEEIGRFEGGHINTAVETGEALINSRSSLRGTVLSCSAAH